MKKKVNYLVGLGMLSFMLAILSNFVALRLYSYSPLRVGEDVIGTFNRYYAERLREKRLLSAEGPHYWDHSKLVWIGENNIMSIDVGSGEQETRRKLPEGVTKKRVFLSRYILADEKNVYYRAKDSLVKVLDDFRCWHECASETNDEEIILGEYGDRVYSFDRAKQEKNLVLEKPVGTTHFHFTKVDPITGRIYSSLGDSHKDGVTGVLSYDKNGESVKWIHVTRWGGAVAAPSAYSSSV